MDKVAGTTHICVCVFLSSNFVFTRRGREGGFGCIVEQTNICTKNKRSVMSLVIKKQEVQKHGQCRVNANLGKILHVSKNILRIWLWRYTKYGECRVCGVLCAVLVLFILSCEKQINIL